RMNNKSVALCAAAVLIASVQWAPAYATPMACTDPEPAGTLDCGVFLGPGNMGTLGPGGNPLKTLYWNDDTANPLFGNTSFTEYSQVAKWDFEAGWEDENGLLAGIVSILGS